MEDEREPPKTPRGTFRPAPRLSILAIKLPFAGQAYRVWMQKSAMHLRTARFLDAGLKFWEAVCQTLLVSNKVCAGYPAFSLSKQ